MTWGEYGLNLFLLAEKTKSINHMSTKELYKIARHALPDRSKETINSALAALSEETTREQSNIIRLRESITEETAKERENIVNAHNALDKISQRRGAENQGFTFDLSKYNQSFTYHNPSAQRADCEMGETCPVYHNAQVVTRRMESGVEL